MKVLVIFTLLLVASLASYDIESILRDVPENELNSFLRHHIVVGHDLVENVLENSDSLPVAFCIALYEYALETAKIKDETRLDKLRELVCFDDGVCIDMGDIGAHPIFMVEDSKERFKLLRRHIRIGHDLLTNKLEETPDNYSIKLYQYALAYALITDEKYVAELMQVICFDDGVCLDVGEIGNHP